MPVELLIARPASGKTQSCIHKVQQVLSQSPLATVWVVVPDRRQGAAFRQRLAGAGGAIGARVGTFGDLYRSLLEHGGRYIPMASSPMLHFIIQEVVESAFTQGELIHYASLRTMPGFFLALRDAFAELKRSLIFPDKLIEYSKNGTSAQGELANLYLLYQSRLRELGWADPEGLSWLAVELLEADPSVANSIRMIVLDGFDSFTGAQHRALELLARRVGDLLITFPGEMDSRRLAHRRFRSTIQKLAADLAPTITTAAQASFLPHDVLYLEQSLFEPGENPADSPDHPFLLEARSPAEEAREALRWIKARVVRDGIALSDCAIFTPNPELYNPFLRASAQEFGIPMHFSRGTALTASPAIRALLNLLALPAHNFRSRLLFNVLRSPYFEFGLDSSSIDMLEEISRRVKIIEGQKQWVETWDRLRLSPAQQTDFYDERRFSKLPRGEQAQSLQRSLQVCFDLLALPAEPQSRTSWVSWLEDLLDRLGFYEKANNERDESACEILRETLRALVLSETILGEHQLAYKDFVSSLQSALSGAGLPEPPLKGQPALLIGQMADARGVRFKAVALLGFSEGLFPQVERSDPFLDESLRQSLGLEQRLNREQAGLFYQAITRTDQYLLITRPYLSENGEKWEPSPFWKDVQRRFDKTALRVVRPEDTPSLNESASSQELLFWAVRHKSLPGRFSELAPRWETLRHARDILRARRAKRAVGAHDGFSPNISRNLAERYPPGAKWSASRLETYGSCPHQFFVNVALGLEPRTVPELGWDASQLGSMLHKVLEQVYSTVADPSDVATLQAALPEVANKVFEDAPAEYGFRPSPLWEIEKSELLSALQQTVDELNTKSQGWKPMAYEQKFGINGSPPLQIDLGGETIQIRGMIDRIDRNEQGDLRVVDYKTGSSHQEPKDLESGIRLQLPLYALAAQDTLQMGTVVEGLYWSISSAKAGALKLSEFGTDNGQGVEEAIKIVVEHLKRILAGIRAGEFPPSPPKDGCSSYCPAMQWCWHYKPAWGGGK
jgi:ATP-dependent helicase/nuclease subunit B